MLALMLPEEIIGDFRNAKNRQEAAEAFAWALRGSTEIDDPIWKRLAEIGLQRWSQSGYMYIKTAGWKLFHDWREHNNGD